MPITTRTQVPNEVDAFYDRLLLLRVLPAFVHQKFAQMRPLPSNSGSDVIRFRRYDNLPVATTPLTEGATPASNQLSQSMITGTVNQYGAYVEITDKLDFLSIDSVMTEAVEILGDQAGLTLDTIVRDVINAGTNVIYPGVAVSRVTIATTDLITTGIIDKAIRTLKNNNARRVLPMINPSQNTATEAVDMAYFAIVHPSITYTLQNLAGFIKVKDYPSQAGVMEHEVGSYNQVRFIESTNAKVFPAAGASAQDIYSTLFIASDAYGVTEISGQGLKSFRKPFGSAGTADPLDQRGTAGWKATHLTKILNDNFLVRVETSAAA